VILCALPTSLGKSIVPLQAKFLNMVQALEAYHRRKEDMTQLDLPEKEHSMRVESIIGTVSPQYKEWLNDKLNYSNEISLRRRLKDILHIYEKIIAEFFFQQITRERI
jgi:hypothetical protein